MRERNLREGEEAKRREEGSRMGGGGGTREEIGMKEIEVRVYGFFKEETVVGKMMIEDKVIFLNPVPRRYFQTLKEHRNPFLGSFKGAKESIPVLLKS